MDYKRCSLNTLIDDAKEDKHRIEWLKNEAARKVKGKPISFLTLKRNYFMKFHPDDVIVATKKKTFRDVIKNL